MEMRKRKHESRNELSFLSPLCPTLHKSLPLSVLDADGRQTGPDRLGNERVCILFNFPWYLVSHPLDIKEVLCTCALSAPSSLRLRTSNPTLHCTSTLIKIQDGEPTVISKRIATYPPHLSFDFDRASCMGDSAQRL